MMFGETIVLHSRSGEAQDGDGNDVPSYTDATITNVAVAPRAATGTSAGAEVTDGGDQVATGLTLIFLAAVAVTALDQVTVRGHRWDVDGEPNDFRSPLTGTQVTSVNLSKVTG